jgi:IclR family acetate operon transcriptional repressor
MKPATTITKVCRVLNEFRNRPCMGVTELARRTDLLPSDVHRILSSLQACGFIDRNPATRTYRLGVGIFKLGLTVLQRSELCEQGRPLLKRLSDEVEATAHMAIFDPHELDIFLAEQVDFPEQTPFKSCLGSRANPTRSALGKTIMANIDREAVVLLLQKSGSFKKDGDVLRGLAQIEGELGEIRRQGYGLDIEQSVKGACCVGAPVRDFTGNTIGAISVSMTAKRFYGSHESYLAANVKACAAELSIMLGCDPRAMAATSGTPMQRLT